MSVSGAGAGGGRVRSPPAAVLLRCLAPRSLLFNVLSRVSDFILGGSKITADGECSHEIKRCLLLERNAMTNLDSNIKKQRHYFAN